MKCLVYSTLILSSRSGAYRSCNYTKAWYQVDHYELIHENFCLLINFKLIQLIQLIHSSASFRVPWHCPPPPRVISLATSAQKQTHTEWPSGMRAPFGPSIPNGPDRTLKTRSVALSRGLLLSYHILLPHPAPGPWPASSSVIITPEVGSLAIVALAGEGRGGSRGKFRLCLFWGESPKMATPEDR